MKRFYYTILALALLGTACTRDWDDSLSGTGEKSPLQVVTNLTVGKAATKAYDNFFEGGDQLLAYIQAGKTMSSFEDENQFSGLHTFNLKSAVTNTPVSTDPNERTQYTTDLTESIYWDDFSSTKYDLRKDDRGIRLFYGFCYNGGTPSTALDAATGVIGWTVQTNQSTDNGGTGFKNSDLLFAKTQAPIQYTHDPADRPKLVLPFYHAMSKVTIQVECKDGFPTDKDNFATASVEFKGLNTTCTVNAPEETVTNYGTPLAITGKDVEVPGANKNVTRSYTAVFAPTAFADGKELATLKGVGGNDYTIVLTEAVLTTRPDGALYEAWSSKLSADGVTQPGVNYLLKVTVNKQEITVEATITNWDNVSAEANAQIQFAHDITRTGSIDESLRDGGFDVYTSKTASSSSYAKQTSVTFDSESGKWTYDPAIFWPTATDKFYFRALSPSGASTSMTKGQDLLWATTSKEEDVDDADGHKQTFYEGGLLPPRTGDVPLDFRHAMTKITFNLIDMYADYYGHGTGHGGYAGHGGIGHGGVGHDGLQSPYLDLTDAKVQITNVFGTGTIDIHDGKVRTSGSRDLLFPAPGFYAAKVNGEATSYAADQTVRDYLVVPQVINVGNPLERPRIVVTLRNGTTYSVDLADCVAANTAGGSSETFILEWESGKHYIYDINLSAQTVVLLAQVKQWEEVEGSGNATIDWD